MATELALQPFNVLLKRTLDQLEEKDTSYIFLEPVSLEEVPDYLEHITTPMDFSTMRKKLDNHEYKNVDQLEVDFELMISNCMVYNAKDTVFYRAAIKMRDQGGTIVRGAKRTLDEVGFDKDTGLHTPEKPLPKDPIILEDIDSILSPEMRENMALDDQLRLLLDKLDMANNAARPHRKSRLAKQIKREINKVRRQLALQKGQDSFLSDPDDYKSSDTAASEDEDAGSPPAPHLCSTPNPIDCPGSPDSKGNSIRRRGRPPGRPRRSSLKCEEEGNCEEDQSKPPKEPIKDEDKTPDPCQQTPTGVSRRTAVLFGKKSKKRSRDRKDSEGVTSQDDQTSPKKTPGRPTRSKIAPPCTDSESSIAESSSVTGSVTDKNPETPDSKNVVLAGGSSRKRTASLAGMISVISPTPETSASSQQQQQPPSKRSVSISEPISTTIADGPTLFSSSKKDSFLRYRNFSLGHSDIDSSSESGRTDSSMSDSDSSSKDSSSDSEGGSSSKRYSKRVRRRKHSGDAGVEDENAVPLEPLDLVWAKCRGYPWYPALIINPKMPKTGYFHNGVPIPVPPEEVLLLQQKHDVLVYLVLFFDTKRTWQWLPRTKLEPLGVDSGLDKAKLLENKKPNVRKAVRKAYEKAILHRCRVTGEPNPLSSAESDSED